MRYNSFKYGDAVYSASRRGGNLVGIRFLEEGDGVGGGAVISGEEEENGFKVYVTKIIGFLEYHYSGHVYRFMQVKYFYRRSISRSCWKDESGKPKFGIKYFDPYTLYADSSNCIVPVNRIFTRYCLFDKSIAIEIDRKLRF